MFRSTGTLHRADLRRSQGRTSAHLGAAAHPLADRPSALPLKRERLKIVLDTLQLCYRVRTPTQNVRARRLRSGHADERGGYPRTKSAVRTARHLLPSANHSEQVPLNTK